MDRPELVPVLRDARTAIPLLLLPPALVGAYELGLAPWRCPLMGSLGCRCPGCGLTRAGAALLRGDLATSLALHPFALAFAAGWVLLLIHRVIGPSARVRMERRVARFEQRIPVSGLLLGGFLLYGMGRLVLDLWNAAGS